MVDIFIILYILGAIGLMWYFLRKPKKKPKRKQLDIIEPVALKQAEELDEKSKILIELYEKLYKEKEEREAKTSQMADAPRSQSSERRVN